MQPYSIIPIESTDWKDAIIKTAELKLDWETVYRSSTTRNTSILGEALNWVHNNLQLALPFLKFWAQVINQDHSHELMFCKLFIEQGFDYPGKLFPEWCPAFCIELVRLFSYKTPDLYHEIFSSHPSAQPSV